MLIIYAYKIKNVQTSKSILHFYTHHRLARIRENKMK